MPVNVVTTRSDLDTPIRDNASAGVAVSARHHSGPPDDQSGRYGQQAPTPMQMHIHRNGVTPKETAPASYHRYDIPLGP